MSRSGRDDDSDFIATAAQYSHSPLPVGGAALSEKEGGHPLFLWLISIPGSPKPVLIGESGVLPDPEAVHREKTGWSSYMTWSKDFCLTEEYIDSEMLKKVYDSHYAITKEDLPQLY